MKSNDELAYAKERRVAPIEQTTLKDLALFCRLEEGSPERRMACHYRSWNCRRSPQWQMDQHPIIFQGGVRVATEHSMEYLRRL